MCDEVRVFLIYNMNKQAVNYKRYKDFVSLVSRAYPDSQKAALLIKAQEEWNKVKNDEKMLTSRIAELKATEASRKSNNMTFWAGVFSPPAKKRITQVETKRRSQNYCYRIPKRDSPE